ncbi:MAG: SDR family NAD(P)-dependent oxidoreductase [Erythrobacter sp.]
MAQMLIFGLGYTASRLAERLRSDGWQVDATGSAGNLDFTDGEAVKAALERATHVLSSVPPDRKSGLDPVLSTYGRAFGDAWYGYLSSTGIYGDAVGAWVDESAPTGTGRRSARSDADTLWVELGAHVFRLPGIYGPGRSAFERLNEGKARRIDMPDQVFSRCHVDDIVSGVIAGLEAPAGAYNLSDDLPASGNAVIEEACRLSGAPLPPMQSLEEANLSPMALGFYSENRRVANGKAKRVLGWAPQYPTYREGLLGVRDTAQ